jgi:hypothetical protein
MNEFNIDHSNPIFEVMHQKLTKQQHKTPPLPSSKEHTTPNIIQ